MKTFITEVQHDALKTVFGSEIETFLSSIKIGVSVPEIGSARNTETHLNQNDVRRMLRATGERPGLTFTIEEIRSHTDGRPWISLAQADFAAHWASDFFEYGEKGTCIENGIRAIDLPLDPPSGWFQWTSRCGTIQWQEWDDDDDTIASCHGWKVQDLNGSPAIVREHDCDAFGSDEDAENWVREVGRDWNQGHDSDCGSVASRAIALIAQGADQQQTGEAA